MNSLLPAIQFLSTLAAAFVAIQYVKSFTDILCSRYFHSTEKIKKAFAQCREELPDFVTLNTIQPITIGDGSTSRSTSTDIERLKREHEKISSSIDKSENEYEQTFSDKCQVCSLSSISLYILLYGIILMLTAGIEDRYEYITHMIVLGTSAFMLIYIIGGWFIGEGKKERKLLNFSDPMHPVICFGITILLTGIICTVFRIWFSEPVFITNCWWWVLFISLILSFANFIVFPVKIYLNAKKTMKEIETKSGELYNQCKKLHEDFNRLMGFYNYLTQEPEVAPAP